MFSILRSAGTESQRFFERHTRLLQCNAYPDDLVNIDHNNAVAEGFDDQTQLVRLGGDFRVAGRR